MPLQKRKDSSLLDPRFSDVLPSGIFNPGKASLADYVKEKKNVPEKLPKKTVTGMTQEEYDETYGKQVGIGKPDFHKGPKPDDITPVPDDFEKLRITDLRRLLEERSIAFAPGDRKFTLIEKLREVIENDVRTDNSKNTGGSRE